MGSTAAEMLVNPTTSEKNMDTLPKNSGGTGLPCRTCSCTLRGSILPISAESRARDSRLRPSSASDRRGAAGGDSSAGDGDGGGEATRGRSANTSPSASASPPSPAAPPSSATSASAARTRFLISVVMAMLCRRRTTSTSSAEASRGAE